MMFLLFFLSAITPPSNENITIGINEHAVTAPNKTEEFVSLSRYSGKANRRIAFPNKDMI